MRKAAEATVEVNDAPRTNVSSECGDRQRNQDLAAEEAVRRRITDNGMRAFYFRHVTCECATGVLTVRGRVPTYRLKNVLWALIKDLDGVTEIDDQLDVVSTTGLSSVRPR